MSMLDGLIFGLRHVFSGGSEIASSDSLEDGDGITLEFDGGTNRVRVRRAAPVVITPPLFGTSQNDYAPTGLPTADVVRLIASATVNLTGLSATAIVDKPKMLVNVGSNAITLKHNSLSSAGPNRFALASGVDYVLNPNDITIVYYDQVSLVWRKAT